MKRTDLSGGVRERLVRLPPPYEHHYGVRPQPLPETSIPLDDVTALHAQAQRALGQADDIAQSLPDPYQITRILSRREAVSSSAMEGTHSTLDELLIADENEDHAGHTVRQVRDYALALEHFLPAARLRGREIFQTDLIQSLHRHVLGHDPSYRDVPGAFRNDVVWIGGNGHIAYSIYNPPPPAEVPHCLDHTLDYMREDGLHMMTQSLISRMALAHAHFEAVHPFRDGNGRVGRLLLPLMMAAEHHVPLYLSPYIEQHKDAYYAALKHAQQRVHWLPLIGFIARAIIETVQELRVSREALQTLHRVWLTRRSFRKGSASLRALDVLTAYPVLTAQRLGTLLAITPPAALTAIHQLCQAGILRERTGYARNRIYAADDVLTILNRPFAEEPVLPET
ncbi:Fic family protein [Neokomagataea anthophila]|uniref:Fic family protein n=1 Tax=Neokomagataea anthophila TaxID=2826925 RepID=A0ABS5E978_9PROT|nr:Fic/DOC family N-terminal domain-containing protein [Neokomagataea anthophila]MBR0560463.1 Fic family protein [Neokomagataea anthophila]